MSDTRITPRPFRFPSEFEPTKPLRQLQRPDQTGAPSFAETIQKAVGDVNALQQEAAGRVEEFVRGEDVPLHEVVLAQEEAEIAFRLMLEVRDRLVRAYQEILRTPM